MKLYWKIQVQIQQCIYRSRYSTKPTANSLLWKLHLKTVNEPSHSSHEFEIEKDYTAKSEVFKLKFRFRESK